MTLEDFFTLTEMKDGLTSLARVEELVSVMNKEKDTSVKNFSDAIRQWAAVASAIAATENKECLDLFIQLGGLWFIERWLKDAQSFAKEASDCFVEEAISALLQAIERLQIENEKLISSGICITVKNLLSYRSSKVQDRARALFDTWKAKDVDVISIEVEKAVISSDPELNKHMETTADDCLPTISVGDQHLKSVEKTNDRDSSEITSNHADSKDACPDTVGSLVKLEAVEGNVSARTEGCPSDTKQRINEAISEELKPEDMVEDARYDNKIESVPDRSGNNQVSSASDDIDNTSRNDAMVAEETLTKTDVNANGASEDALSNKCTSGNDIVRLVVESSNGMDKIEGLESKGLDQADGCSALEECKDRGTTNSRSEDIDGCKKEPKKHRKGKGKSKSKNKHFGNSCDLTRLTKDSKNADAIRQMQDMDLENGIVDALELARLVAKEVEREVVGYYEQSGSSSSSSSSSSSKSISRSSSREPESPESSNRGEDLQTDGPTKELLAMERMSDNEPLGTSANQDAKLENHVQDMESSQVTESNTEKSTCGFDLNKEFSSLDPHPCHLQVDTISNPASIVSASRAIAAPEMPAAPLNFEGNLGWKGSAATSAFRPASPRQASSSDNRALSLSGGGTSSDSRQRREFLDIDLNVAEGGDDKVVDPDLATQKALPPGLPSCESSVELSPKRTEKLIKFDLNQIGDDGDVPSPASSSCIQPTARNFDLNHNLSICNDQQLPFLGESSSSEKVVRYVGPSSDDSVISILGTKVKKNTIHVQTPLPLPFPFPNGSRVLEPVVDSGIYRGGSIVGSGHSVPPYAPQSVYAYNGFAMGPTVPFPSGQIYGGPNGLIPYMLDPRGSPYMAQMVGSTSSAAIRSSYPQHSFVMNLMGPTPISDTASPYRPNIDFSSGYVEGGNRDPSFYRPLFIPGQAARPPLEEQMRENFFRPLNSSSSGTSSGKRKEPETGWELFPTNYKHHQPPHL